MITSVAVQAYLTHIGQLFLEQGFRGVFRDPSMAAVALRNMRVVYDAEEAMTEEWLADELASTKMPRKGVTTKETVRKDPFMALFWKRGPLEPIVRQRYRLLDVPEDPAMEGTWGRSTVSASFAIACVFVTNKAEAIEDLEEAFAAVFQNTYNMPLTLQYIYNAPEAETKTPINFTYIQNMGESDLVNFKDGNLFAYSWSAKVYMNYVSEFAWSRVYPAEKVVVDLYNPKGIPLSSLDAAGIAHTHDYKADTGEVVENVPDEPLVAFTSAESHDFVPFAISAPYSGEPGKITSEGRALIEGAVINIGGEVSLRRTDYMVIVNVPLAANHAEGNDYDADVLASSAAISAAIKEATGEDYVVTPMSDTDGK